MWSAELSVLNGFGYDCCATGNFNKILCSFFHLMSNRRYIINISCIILQIYIVVSSFSGYNENLIRIYRISQMNIQKLAKVLLELAYRNSGV